MNENLQKKHLLTYLLTRLVTKVCGKIYELIEIECHLTNRLSMKYMSESCVVPLFDERE